MNVIIKMKISIIRVIITLTFLNILDKVAEIRALLATICRNYQGRTLNGTEITEIEIIVNQLYAEKRYYK